MCGIAGYYQRNGKPVEKAILCRLLDQIIHRGPDDSGTWIEGPIGLGHRRLSIRDLSADGRQPMQDPSGRVLVTYNGEIYNYDELRRELERDHGFTFHTRTDTELLPLGYLVWGEELFNRIEGMFAIALWDRTQQRLLLARDGIGIKPLYYFENQDVVVFGSEVKAIIASGICEKKINLGSLHSYLAAGFSGPSSSLVQGIKQVPPGVFLSFRQDICKQHRFWHPTRKAEIDDLNHALEEFLQLLPKVVASQLVSDVPISVLQSGGIDSTLVSLTLRGLKKDTPLFTAGFSDTSHDESDLAGAVARVAGQSHHILNVERDQTPVETFKKIVHHFDGQCADTGAYAFYRLCEEVRKHSTVVLSGDGGDEFFCGYDTYRASQYAKRITPWLPSFLLELLGKATYHMGADNESRLPLLALVSRFALGMASGGAHAHMQWRRLIPAFMLPKLYGKIMQSFLSINPYSEYEACAQDVEKSSLDYWLLADQRFHLQSILMKVDAMSMAHSLEVRVPLLDRRIMDFSGRCSTKLFLPQKGPTKLLLRRAALKLQAPLDVLSAKKRGFNVPIAKMLRKDLYPLSMFWLDDNADIFSPCLNPDEIRKIWREHLSGETNHAYVLWPILTLAEWFGDKTGKVSYS